VTTYTLVRPEHLNHFGYLFGGQMLKWVDEYSWLAATREFPGQTFVTRAMSDVEFRRQVRNGSILRFVIEPAARGHTSVVYHVEVFGASPGESTDISVFATDVVFVSVDPEGRKTPLAAPGE